MIYSFSEENIDPNNDPDIGTDLVYYYSQMSDAEIELIRTYGDSLDTTNVKLYGRYDDSNVRAKGSHFPLTDKTRWVYDRISELAQEINSKYFKYDLSGFCENFYYLKYEAPRDHFNWHVDIGPKTPAPRKLSLVLQLSDPSEYDGGEFEVMTGVHEKRALRSKGLILAFPSYKNHRVTPVSRGVRRTLTMFTCGPNFR